MVAPGGRLLSLDFNRPASRVVRGAYLAYLAVVGTCVAFGLYYWVLRTTPAYKMSLIAYVTPVIALFLGWSVGKEPVGLSTLCGAGLVLGGVGLVRRPAA